MENKLGNYLRLRRMERGMSQKDAAKKIGFTRQALCQIEKGHRIPRVDRVALIEDVMGIKRNELLKLLPKYAKALTEVQNG